MGAWIGNERKVSTSRGLQHCIDMVEYILYLLGLLKHLDSHVSVEDLDRVEIAEVVPLD